MVRINEDTRISVVVDFVGGDREAETLLFELLSVAFRLGLDATGLWSTHAHGSLRPIVGNCRWSFCGSSTQLAEFLKEIGGSG